MAKNNGNQASVVTRKRKMVSEESSEEEEPIKEKKRRQKTKKKALIIEGPKTPTAPPLSLSRQIPVKPTAMAADLPDELILKILEMGIQIDYPNSNSRLSYKDLCCLSISSRRLRSVANDISLWSSLLSLDFPSRFSESTNRNDAIMSPKLLYQSWFEKEKAKRIAAEKRAVMRVESRIAEHMRRVKDLLQRRVAEEEKVKCVADEINNLRRVRQASVALNVWQPEIVRGRQKQIVEQCAVPVDSRINALEMELRLCKQQLVDFEKSYFAEKRRLKEERERLTSMNYHPLYDHAVIPSTVDGHKIRSTAVDHDTKRRKFKRFGDDFTS